MTGRLPTFMRNCGGYVRRRFGLRQRIMALVVGMALAAAAVVTVSLHKQSLLLAQSAREDETERLEQRVHESSIALLQTVNIFSQLNLDLSAAENAETIANGERELSRFESLQPAIKPFLAIALSEDERRLLDKAAVEVRRSWFEIVSAKGAASNEEITFHLMSAAENAGIVRRLILKTDQVSKAAIVAARDALAKSVETAKKTVLVLLLGGLPLAVGGAWLLLNLAVKRPLGAAVAAVSRLASGDLVTAVPKPSSDDEIGAILAALEIFRDNALVRRQLAEDRARDMVERDKRREQLEATIAEFRTAVIGVLHESEKATKTMSLSAQELIDAAADSQSEAGRATGASREVSSKVAGIAAATQQLSESVDSIGHSVKQAEAAIEKAALRAVTTSDSIDGLSEAARTIGEVVSFIDSVASQTNLLALNATIEAARAGAAGRGFAVVAAEVKSLATQTASATEKIAARIDDMRKRTGEAVGGMRVIFSSNGEASEHASIIAHAVGSQNEVTSLISGNLQEVASSTAGLSGIVEDLATAVDRANQAAERVQAASGASVAAVGKFDGLVEQFLKRVMAA